ncbi:MAG: hypothetical protein AB7E24_15815 [Novosphingobium sp.]
MADVGGFLIETVLRLIFEALFEGIWYGLKKVWYFLTGQGQKAEKTLAAHKVSQERRRQAVENIRQRRRKRKKKR